jgi:hypothetical protein
MFKELDSDAKTFIITMVVALTFILVGGFIEAIMQRDGIKYICHGDLIVNTPAKSYECKPKKDIVKPAE